MAEFSSSSRLPTRPRWQCRAGGAACRSSRRGSPGGSSARRTATIVVAGQEAFDARQRLPEAPFWQTYVRGTRQNTANFAGHKMWRQPGVYLFRLAGSFDTKRLADDIYVLVATATDTRGNTGTGRFVFTIHNKPGFFSR